MPLWVYVCTCMCVWSPHNDYYGLTPISRVGSLHSWFFHSPGKGKENKFPFGRLQRPFWSHNLKHRNHTRAHTPSRKHTHAPMPTLWTDEEPIFEFALYLTEGSSRGRSTVSNEDHKHIHKHKQDHRELPRKPTTDRVLLYLDTITHFDKRLPAPCGILGWSKRKMEGFPQGVGTYWYVPNHSDSGPFQKKVAFTKAVKRHWSQHIEQIIKRLKGRDVS